MVRAEGQQDVDNQQHERSGPTESRRCIRAEGQQGACQATKHERYLILFAGEMA